MDGEVQGDMDGDSCAGSTGDCGSESERDSCGGSQPDLEDHPPRGSVGDCERDCDGDLRGDLQKGLREDSEGDFERRSVHVCRGAAVESRKSASGTARARPGLGQPGVSPADWVWVQARFFQAESRTSLREAMAVPE